MNCCDLQIPSNALTLLNITFECVDRREEVTHPLRVPRGYETVNGTREPATPGSWEGHDPFQAAGKVSKVEEAVDFGGRTIQDGRVVA